MRHESHACDKSAGSFGTLMLRYERRRWRRRCSCLIHMHSTFTRARARFLGSAVCRSYSPATPLASLTAVLTRFAHGIASGRIDEICIPFGARCTLKISTRVKSPAPLPLPLSPPLPPPPAVFARVAFIDRLAPRVSGYKFAEHAQRD